MDKVRLHYIANYAGSRKDLRISPAGNAKMEYLISALGSINCPFTIFSTAEVSKGMFFGKKERVSKGIVVRYMPSFTFKVHFLQRAEKLWNKIGLFLYLSRLDKNDVVVVYHNTPYIPVLKKFKNRRFKLIYEVEEIYAQVSGQEANKIFTESEFLKCADGYIFSTELLMENLNQLDKPSVIVYGTYRAEAKRSQPHYSDGKIHCLYAGTFNTNKGGAAAVAAAEFLNDDYHIHIIGFGTNEEKEHIISEINRVSQISECKVTFEGLLSGEEYIRFLQRCDIGLSTQNPNASFNGTSFPSKVLSYLSNGLRVVSVNIEALRRSAIHDMIHYYEGNDPRAIANAIRKVDVSSDYDSRKTIETLNVQFQKELADLICKIYMSVREGRK